MARTAILKPTCRANRQSPWVVNVPPQLSATGKRQELFFSTKGEATAECEKLKSRKDNFGISLSTMTSARIAAAAEAYNLLDQHNIDLLDAVRAHLHVIGQKSASVTFEFAFDRFAELKQTKSAKYQQEIRQAKATFGALLSRLICDVSAQDLEPILDRLPRRVAKRDNASVALSVQSRRKTRLDAAGNQSNRTTGFLREIAKRG